MTREIRPPQQELIDHFCNVLFDGHGVAGWANMGCGKTGATYIALRQLDILGDGVFPALVLAPPRVAENVWPSEILEWPEHMQGIVVSPVVGTAEQRQAALRKKAHIYTMGWDNIDWLLDILGGNWPFRVVVIDEATKLKNLRCHFRTTKDGTIFLQSNAGTKRGRTITDVIWRSKCRVIELTGTPSPNGLKGLWGQLFPLDFGKRLGRTYDGFKERWFAYDPYTRETKPFPHTEREIHAAVRDICLAVDAAKHYRLDKPISIPKYVDLPASVRVQYNEMEKEFFTKIEGHEIEAFNAGVKSGKLSQLANGAAYVGEDDGRDSREFVAVHDEKIKMLEEIIEEANGMPVMCVYNFRSDLARLKKHFPKAVVFDKKKSTEDRFNRGEIELLLVGYGAAHGVSLQHGTNICVIFGMTWDLENYLQIIERIGPMRQFQSGYKRPVFVYPIIARDTIDLEMLDRIESKKSVQDALLEAASKRG